MNRRAFFFSLLTLPVVAHLPDHEVLSPAAERRYVSRSGATGPVDIEVLLAPDERRARGWRNREAHDPFDGMMGEFFVSDSHEIRLPSNLPGTATTYETVVGVAAQEGVVHVGGFRRGVFVWTVRVHGGPVEHVIRAGEAIAGMTLPDPVEARFAPGRLEELLPGPEVFGGDMVPEG